MVRKAVGGGVYKDDSGGFWARPWFLRRRTWRKLKAQREREAIREAASLKADQQTGNFADLAAAYLEAGCPNRRLEPRPEAFTGPESVRVASVVEYFGKAQPEEIKIPLCLKYADWRKRRVKRGTGKRTVDMDLNTLSNIMSYGVAIGRLEFNFVRTGRPRFQRETDVRHSREVAPESAEQIHQIARELFKDPVSVPLGWQMLFAYRTGCRTSELLRLRMDAKEGEAGFISGNHLYLGRRSKRGVNPFVLLDAEFKRMIAAFRAWHRKEYPESPWFFPGRRGGHANAGGLGNAIRRLCKGLGLPHMTPHGLRSFYVTKRRSDGASDAQIAPEIGDRKVELISTTYGDRPANWTGGKRLSWMPKGKPAWRQVDSKVDSLRKGRKRENARNN